MPCAQILNRIPAYNCGMDHSKLMVVDAFASQVEADLAKSVLESAGIDATIQADRAGGMRDHLAWSGLGFKLLVREEDAAEARDVLQPLPESELVLVQALRTEAEADIAYSTLLSAGIAPTIQDTVAGIPLSLTSNAFRFRVLVPKEDAAKARDILTPPSEARTQQSG
jgi:Putative prokaryotic signal transducing protein